MLGLDLYDTGEDGKKSIEYNTIFQLHIIRNASKECTIQSPLEMTEEIVRKLEESLDQLKIIV